MSDFKLNQQEMNSSKEKIKNEIKTKGMDNIKEAISSNPYNYVVGNSATQ